MNKGKWFSISCFNHGTNSPRSQMGLGGVTAWALLILNYIATSSTLILGRNVGPSLAGWALHKRVCNLESCGLVQFPGEVVTQSCFHKFTGVGDKTTLCAADIQRLNLSIRIVSLDQRGATIEALHMVYCVTQGCYGPLDAKEVLLTSPQLCLEERILFKQVVPRFMP